MAAIDKLYVRTYEEMDNLRRWAIVYYPKLILSMYNVVWIMSYNEFVKSKNSYISKQMNKAKTEYKKLGTFHTILEAAENLKRYYKENFNRNLDFTQARYEANCIYDNYFMSKENWEEKYSFPVMNTPFKVDRKLKWICPVPCVREYLHNQCGVNPKLEWLYRIFWRGKKYF